MKSQAAIIEMDWNQFGDPQVVAHQYAHEKGFAWLDSASSDHQDSRYHIIARKPELTLTAHHHEVKLHPHTQRSLPSIPKQIEGQPFKILEFIAQQMAWSVPESDSLPFKGGWLGYWGYDAGRYLESLPERARDDIRLPDIKMGWYNAALIIDMVQQRVVVVGHAPSAEALASELKSHSPNEYSAQFQLTSEWKSNMTAAEYANKFSRVQDYLHAGDCYQVNLAQRHQAHFTGSPFAAYCALRQHNKGPFSAFVNGTEGQVLSVSPERFIRCDGQKIQTKPIKGTRPRKESPQADQSEKVALQNSEKDRAENLMIVDLLRNDIGRVAAPGTVDVPGLFEIESFPAVHHLVSTVTADLNPSHSVYDLLAACFPGGSITGAPKIRAMEIIEELEPNRRSVYCGAIGYISVDGTMDTNIAIRTLVCDPNTIYCWAGGGLVADSQCNDEYQETIDKVSRILPLLSAL